MFKILIIDDDVDILSLLGLSLSHYYIVETLNSSELAFETIDEFNPNLILLDISLKDEDGRNICKQIKSNPATRHIHVILVTAYHKLAVNYADCGADACVEKPFDIRELLQKMNASLRSAV